MSLMERSAIVNVNVSLARGVWNSSSSSISSSRSAAAELAATTHAVIIPLYGLIGVVGTIVNVTILVVIAAVKKLRNGTNMFIANLAASDLLMNFTIVFTPLYAIHNNWIWGLALCKTYFTVTAIGILISAFTLAAIAVYRYAAICRNADSNGHRHRLNVRQAALICAAIWLFAVAVCVPIALHVQTVSRSRRQTLCREMWLNDAERNVYTGFMMALQFAAPVTLMAFCHIRIHGFLKRQLYVETLRFRTAAVDRTLATLRRRERIHRVLFAMVVAHAICWLPLNIFNLVWEVQADLVREWAYTMQFYFAVHILAMLSTVLDPLLYAIMNRQIRLCILHALKRGARQQRSKRGHSQSLSHVDRERDRVVKSTLDTHRYDLTQTDAQAYEL